jgi:hypothetical protein
MKRSLFFPIPESPADVEHLRQSAQPLDESTRPAWLETPDLGHYRYVGEVIASRLNSRQQTQLERELQLTRSAGLIVDADAERPDTYRVYVTTVADHETWSIGVYTGTTPFDLSPAPGVRQPVLSRDDVTDTAAALVADPFLIRDRQRWWMFFELLNWHENKGEIGLAESPDGLHWEYRQRVLVEPFHLSYPHVFAWQGDHYLVPESRQARQVRLYRAVDFPIRWEQTAVLVNDCDLVDATLFVADDGWNMLAGDRTGGQNGRLRLYTSSSLLGPWQEHSCSPVVDNDPAIARPAGRVLVEDGRILRFAQNCSAAYGVDVRAIEIVSLTQHQYEERTVDSPPVLGPQDAEWNRGGMHHLDVHRLDDGTYLASVDGWALRQ